MGGLLPGDVEALAPICGSARTSVQNRLLLEAARVALTTSADYDSGWYDAPPARGLLAFCRAYGSLVACSAFYREREYSKLGRASPEDTMRFFEGFFRQKRKREADRCTASSLAVGQAESGGSCR